MQASKEGQGCIESGVPMVVQDDAVKEHRDRLDVAAQAARQLARRQETCVKEHLEAVRAQSQCLFP